MGLLYDYLGELGKNEAVQSEREAQAPEGRLLERGVPRTDPRSLAGSDRRKGSACGAQGFGGLGTFGRLGVKKK